MGYLVRKGRRAASRADEQVDRALDAGVECLGALIPRKLTGRSEPPAADTTTVPIPYGTGRRWALVASPVSPVHHEPDAVRGPLTYKYRDDRVELFTDVAPRNGWLAVRTPADAPGYKWMQAEDLRIDLPPRLPDRPPPRRTPPRTL